jgi:hypothetical protein
MVQIGFVRIPKFKIPKKKLKENGQSQKLRLPFSLALLITITNV